MMYRLIFPLLLGGAVLLSLSACSDPAGVGANLTSGLEGGTPKTINVAVDSFGTVSATSRTGFESRLGPGASNRSWRFLAGTVDDPLSGTITATGYVDFFGTASRDTTLTEDASRKSLKAELLLPTTYFHGDTTSTFRFTLYDLKEDANMAGASADTSFETESSIKSYSVSSPTDSLLTVELPQKWINEHEEALRSSSPFDSTGSFNGFALVPASGNLVVGFEHSATSIRLTSTDTTITDTVDFQAQKSFTAIERDSSRNLPLKDWTLIQDGAGPNLVFNWDFEDPPLDTLQGTPLNQVDITVPVDTTKMKKHPPNPDFVRPRSGLDAINTYRVLATRAEGTAECGQLGLFPLRGTLDTCVLPTLPSFAPKAARVRSEASYNIFNRALRDTAAFSRYRVEIALKETATAQNSIRRGLPSTLPVLVRTSDAKTVKKPHATLVYTRL